MFLVVVYNVESRFAFAAVNLLYTNLAVGDLTGGSQVSSEVDLCFDAAVSACISGDVSIAL